MKGSKEIIDALNEVLAAELVAINQYFLHAKMCQNWGFLTIAAHTRTESIDEMRHAELIVDRILYLEGLPNLQRLDTLRVGQTVAEQFQSDLQLEVLAVQRLNDAIALCRSKGDRTSEDLLAGILAGEERHIDWLETQLGLIDRLGEQAYLAQQIRAQ
jgi:bacterioferritin